MPLHDRIIPYLEFTGLYHLARLNSHWFWVDEPMVNAFIERWRPKIQTFHMSFEKCTITLQDVVYQLRLPVDGKAVSGCFIDFKQFILNEKPAWEWFEDLFDELQLPNKVIGFFLCHSLSIDSLIWEPYSAADVVHLGILTEEHSRLLQAVTSLTYFIVIEWHKVDRVIPQLSNIRHLPEKALNIDWLHMKDARVEIVGSPFTIRRGICIGTTELIPSFAFKELLCAKT
ncbi:hypothetical protein Ahy_B07g087094 [Arachis hypogaea]|uniref:Aminotransferase-like plant mobile domain-containing protein n=1 Tax=Arachis hypogaea TaxID=3818 RepID=A0A444YB76_ARAHY|nr:hypothetical protein Ahy_B07g087094 [Arachis hypogaea]